MIFLIILSKEDTSVLHINSHSKPIWQYRNRVRLWVQMLHHRARSHKRLRALPFIIVRVCPVCGAAFPACAAVLSFFIALELNAGEVQAGMLRPEDKEKMPELGRLADTLSPCRGCDGSALFEYIQLSFSM